MSSELIEKIKVFYFLTLRVQSRFAECCPKRRDRGLGLYYKGAGEWIPGNI